jgi:nucleoid-associated protein YgaU
MTMATPLARLAKALVINTDTNERIPVMYNPEEYRLEQGNDFAEVGIPGLNAPPVQYVRGKARVLTMDLFFDSYEQRTDVRAHTGRIVALLQTLPRTHAPPILLFTMGQFAFRCVLVDAGQRFTMFLRDGTPVRSVLAVRFHEYVDVVVETQHGLFIGPPTLHTVTAGQTVSAIAAQLLGDPTRWREIADANQIDNPFSLKPGTSIVAKAGGSA